VSVRHRRTRTPEGQPSDRRVEHGAARRDKGKQRQRQDPTNKDKDKDKLEKSLDVWPPVVATSATTPKGGTSSASTTMLQDPVGVSSPTTSLSPTTSVRGFGRRGSVTTVLGGVGGDRNRNFSSGTNTNTASSQSSSPTMEKSRPSGKLAMFLNSISPWRQGRYSPALSASATSLGTTGTPLSGTGTGAGVPGRGPGGKTMRSEEGLRYYHKKGATPGDGGEGECVGAGVPGIIGATALTNERRASSWGQGDQPVEFTDLSSYRLNPVRAPNSGRTRKEEEEREGEGRGPLSSDGEPGFVSSSSSSSGAAVFIVGGANRDWKPLPVFPAAAQSESPSASSSLVRAGVDAASVASGSHGDMEGLGPACFDEDSSTIASAFGDVEQGRHRHEEEGEGGGAESHEGTDDFEDEEVDSDDTDEVPVTFSPRRRVAPQVER